MGSMLARHQLNPLQIDPTGIVETEGVGWNDVLIAIGVGVATVAVAILVGWAIRRWIGRPGSSTQAIAAMAARLVRWTIIIIGTSWALSFVGLSIGWLALTVAAVLAVLVLILKPQLEGLASAVIVTTRPAFDVGDEIEILDYTGTIVEVTSRSMVLRLRDGRRVHLPNAKILSEVVVVISIEGPRRSELTFDLSRAADIELAERVTVDALSGADRVLDDPAPRLLVREIGGGSVSVSLRFWHDSRIGEQNAAIDQAARAVSRALDAAGLVTQPEGLAVSISGDAPGAASASA